ncbi:MAG TPA: N-acetyl sugar amidotransferase [Opitutaceae bacterium]|nr:N-acetyl sugar amidotransferase [Opitutaceae bacterium]
MTVRLCQRCVNPSSRPNLTLDAEGICPVCRYEEKKRDDHIDWAARRAELDEICRWGRTHTRARYDCMVTVSGGKDSLRQACFAREELGMNPLLVNCAYPPEQLTERGARNLTNLIELGFDTLSVSPDPQVWKRLMREGFLRFGNWCRSTEMALYAIPVHVAIAYQIPLIFYGENPVLTIGEKHGRIDGDASQLKKGNTIAGGPTPLLPPDLTPRDAHFYYYPPDEDMAAARLRLVYLGYYMADWSGRANAQFAVARGLEVRTEPPEATGDLWGFSCLDEDFSIVNQFLKYLKLGFGRVTDQVCEAISSGAMTRIEGLDLVRRYDGKCDPEFIRRFCAYLEIPEAVFWDFAEKFRNPNYWRRDDSGQWRLQVEELAR